MWRPDARPDQGLLHAWLDGALAPEAAARVERLVRDDPTWAAAAAEARGLIANASRLVGALDDAPAAGARPRVRQPARRGVRWGSRLAGVAAALLVAVIGRDVWRQQAPQGGRATSRVSVPAAGDRSAPPATRAPARSPMSPLLPTPDPASARATDAAATDSAAPSAPASSADRTLANDVGASVALAAPAQREAFRAQNASGEFSARPGWVDSSGCARLTVAWEPGSTARYEGVTTASRQGHDGALVILQLADRELRATVGGNAPTGRVQLRRGDGTVLRQGDLLGIEPCSAPTPPRD